MSASLMWLLDGIAAVPANEARVADLTLDSREVRAGSLFFALRGRKRAWPGVCRRGRRARRERGALGARRRRVAAGAAARPVRAPRYPDLTGSGRPHRRPVLQLALLAAAHHRHHRHQRQDHLRLPAGAVPRDAWVWPAAYIGTIGWGRLGALEEPTLTTPDAVTVHRMLARLRGTGVREVAMEVSSHALDQDRVDGVRFHSAAFTNLSRDHLDYHADHAGVRRGQGTPVRGPDLKHIVINVGDAFGRELAQRLCRARAADRRLDRRRAIRVARRARAVRDPGATLTCTAFRSTSTAASASSPSTTSSGPLQRRERPGGPRLPAVARRARSREAARARRVRAAARAHGGRRSPAPRTSRLAVVDYAHTPDALAQGLERAARALPRGAVVRVRLRRRPRSRQAAVMGADRRRARRSRSSSPTTIRAPRIRRP